MQLAFQILMAVVIVITFIGSIGETDNEKLRNSMVAICIAAIIGYVFVTWIL